MISCHCNNIPSLIILPRQSITGILAGPDQRFNEKLILLNVYEVLHSTSKRPTASKIRFSSGLVKTV